jgi:DNA-binding transcriptional MerR regulator
MALPQLFSIGEMAKIFHLSVSSLRHYEALGLVTPEYVDPSTNYRYYSVRQFEPLNTIRYLRAMDMPLTEIADFLQNRDVETKKSCARRRPPLYRSKRSSSASSASSTRALASSKMCGMRRSARSRSSIRPRFAFSGSTRC